MENKLANSNKSSLLPQYKNTDSYHSFYNSNDSIKI
jgi:hypothetical protein